MAGEDEIEISATLRESISAALGPMDRRLDEFERRLDSVGRKARKTGKDVGQGLGEAENATEDLGQASRRAEPPVRKLGDETAKTGAKAAAGSKGLDEFAKKADKAGLSSRRSGRMIVNSFKFAGVITGVFALAGGVSALGAGGAIAVGGLAPLVGVLGLLPPLLLATKLAMLAGKLAAEQLEQPLTRIKNQFTQLGEQIAGGGLRSGLDFFADSMVGLSRVTGTGLSGIGAEMGEIVREAGRLARSGRFLDQVAVIFLELRPIVRDIGRGLLYLTQAMLNLIQAALPATIQFAGLFLHIAEGLANWTQQVLANGKASMFFVYALNLLRRVTGVLVDFLIGLFNILRIGAGYADEFGLSIEAAAWKFRQWTGSAEGQARINQYFQDSLPALREMGLLLGMIVGGFAKLGASQDVAPLLAQIRTEFAPALGELLTKLSGQGGLGPALITAATALVQFFASLDFSGLTAFMLVIAQVANALVWLATNVPGANFVLSALLTSMLGFKLLGPVFSIVGKGASAFSWMYGALRLTANLSKAQIFFKTAVSMLWTVFKIAGAGIITVIRAIGVAFMANPVGFIIGIVIGLIMLLWFKCEWFRDAVITAWEWIAMAAGVAWKWIVNAVGVAIDWIVDKSLWLWNNGIKPVWEIISTAVGIYIQVWVTVTKFVVSVISSIVTSLWENVVRPVWGFISSAAEIAWNVIKFIVQTVVFFIAVHVAALAWVLEKTWNAIAAAGTWVWEKILGPIVGWFVDFVVGSITKIQNDWNRFVGYLMFYWAVFKLALGVAIDWISQKWTTLTTALGIAWNAFYNATIKPVIDGFKIAWEMVTSFVSENWNKLTNGLSTAWGVFSDFIGSRIDRIKEMWDSATSWLKETFAPVGDVLGKIWEGISSAAEKAAGIVRSAWDKAVGMVKSAYNTIAGAWNSIPSVTVPDWVPGMGGNTFSLPKLPMLWHGGEVGGGGKAIVGEHGPEPLVKNGRVIGMLGQNGPEVASIPRGGYVVPNLDTLSALPGLTKTLPAGVAAAVARSVPGYAGALRGRAPRDDGMRRAVEKLTRAMAGQMPPVTVEGTGDIAKDVYEAWKKFRREEGAKGNYSYEAGKG